MAEAVRKGSSSSSAESQCTSPTAEPRELIKILLNDGVLLKNWSELSDSLDCPPVESLVWERGIQNASFTYYEVFSQILKSWTTRNPNKTVKDLCQILQTKLECVSTVEQVEANFGKDDVIKLLLPTSGLDEVEKRFHKSPITHGLLATATNFSGRVEELSLLKSSFYSNKTTLILICGLSGIGKTELCRKFANDVSVNHDVSFTISRIWLHGETIETLRDSILQLAVELGVSNENNSPPSKYFEYLASAILDISTRLLVVIDNVDVVYAEVTKIIKRIKKYKRIFVIVTSRDSLLIENAGLTIKLDALLNFHSRKMIQRSMHGFSDTDANQLSKLLQYFPFALQQSIAYIKQQRNNFRTRSYGVPNYVAEFEAKKSKIVNDFLSETDFDYTVTSLVTLNMTIEKLSCDAVEILKIVSHLEPDRIELDFLERVCKRSDLKSFDDGLSMLDNYSLIKIEGEILSIHRLVQEVVRENIKNSEECTTAMELDVLTKHQARIMLQSSITDLADYDADKLGYVVQQIPLALQQAIAYINQQKTHFRTRNYSVSEYINEFEKKKKQMLEHRLNEFQFDHKMTTFVTWDMTIEKMSDVAISILNIVAYLDPDYIELKFLERICKCRSLQNFDEGMGMLDKYSLVKIEDDIVSIHRLVQEVMRGKINNSDEYSKTLFDSVFLACGTKGHSWSEQGHLKSVYRLAWKCEMGCIVYFHDALLFLLQHNRIECAVEYSKLQCKNIRFSSDLDVAGKIQFIEKLFLWAIVNDGFYDSVTNEIVENGTYTYNIDWLPATSKSLKFAISISEKCFGGISKITFAVKNRLAEELCNEGCIEKALIICRELLNSSPLNERKNNRVYCRTINYIVKKLDKIGDYEKHTYSSQLETVLKIVAQLSNIFSSKLTYSLKVLQLKAKVLHLSGDFQKSLEVYDLLFQKYQPTKNERIIRYYRTKVIELKTELTDFNVITKEEIVNDFSEADYNILSLQGLNRLMPSYQKILGDEHPLTVRIKNEIARKLWDCDQVRCITLCKEVLDSPVDYEYEGAFEFLSIAKHISYNYEEQKTLLAELLEVKKSQKGEAHSNTIRVCELLAKRMEKLGKLKDALTLFEQVRNWSVTKNSWSADELKFCAVNVTRLKLRIGDFSNLMSPEDLYEEFSLFEDYNDLSLKELENILPFYEKSLGKNDKLTLKVINALALKLSCEEKRHSRSLALLERVIESKDEDEIKVAYSTMQDIGEIVCYLENDYMKSNKLLNRVLEFRTVYQGKDHEDTIRTKTALAATHAKLNISDSDCTSQVQNYSDSESESSDDEF